MNLQGKLSILSPISAIWQRLHINPQVIMRNISWKVKQERYRKCDEDLMSGHQVIYIYLCKAKPWSRWWFKYYQLYLKIKRFQVQIYRLSRLKGEENWWSNEIFYFLKVVSIPAIRITAKRKAVGRRLPCNYLSRWKMFPFTHRVTKDQWLPKGHGGSCRSRINASESCKYYVNELKISDKYWQRYIF